MITTITTGRKYFMTKVEPQQSGCWHYTGFINKGGYGTIGFRGNRCFLAHRVSWILHVGEIPQGLFVLHKCDNRKCVNPDHLFLGTIQDNVDDMYAKGRANNVIAGHQKHWTHCKHGHSFELDGVYISNTGRRRCKKCHNQCTKEWAKRNKQTQL